MFRDIGTACSPLFSCVAGPRLPGRRASRVCGVEGSVPGVGLVPVRVELLLDPLLDGGEVRGCGVFVLVLRDPAAALGSRSVSSMGQALRRNDG